MEILFLLSNYLYKLGEMMNFREDIPESEANKLLEKTRNISLKKDEYFLRAGDVPQYIGFNLSGLLRLFYIDHDGKEINKHFCTEHTLAISYSAFLLREKSKLYIQALENTTLSVIDYNTYTDLLNGHQCWQAAARKLANLLFIIKEKREAELLQMDAKERYLQFLKDFPGLNQRVSQYHIASYLHITPESLSRIRSSLVRN